MIRSEQKKQRGRPFAPGVSGNPGGRPKGARNLASIIAAALTDKDASAVVRAVVAKAKKGDMAAARLVLDRIWPAPRGRSLTLDLPAAVDAAGVHLAHRKLLQSVADGALSPEEAQAISAMLSLQLKMMAGNGPERSTLTDDGSLPTGPATGLPPPKSVIVMYGEPPASAVEPHASPNP